MTANSCPRCAKALPENTLRALPQGTTCPFCSAPLKRTPSKRAATPAAPAPAPAPPPSDDGYASFEMSAARPASPAAPKVALPGSTTAAQRVLRQTMVGGTSVARDLPFNATPAPAAISLAPPVSAPAAPAPARTPESPARATAAATPTPPVRGSAAAALARTIAAPPPARAPSTRPALAPAAGRPRTLTPAQALDLPPPTPAPVLKTPPPTPLAPARAVGPLISESQSGPTRVSPESPRASAAASPLVTESDSGPTSVAAPRAPNNAAVEPVLTFPDSEPIIDSVTMTAEAEPPPAAQPPLAAVTLPAPVAPRRGLALIGIGMGMAIIALAFAGFHLLRGPKTTVAPVVAQAAKPAPEVQPAAPVVEPVQPEPAARQEAPRAKAESPAPAPAKAEAPAPAKAAPPPPTKVAHERPARARHEEQPVAETHTGGSRRHGATHRSRAHERHPSHARQVAMREPAPKKSAAPAPAEHADPRPPYEHGNTLLLSGDSKGALVAYREAVKTAPSDPIGFRGLGLAYEQEGEPALAVRALRRYLKLAPDAPDRELIAKRIAKLSKRSKQK
jgi:hypothetical protein